MTKRTADGDDRESGRFSSNERLQRSLRTRPKCTFSGAQLLGERPQENTPAVVGGFVVVQVLNAPSMSVCKTKHRHPMEEDQKLMVGKTVGR